MSSLRAVSGVSVVFGLNPDPEKWDFIIGIVVDDFRGPVFKFSAGPFKFVIPMSEKISKS